MSKDTIVRGTMLLTAATFLSKFLGMIYVIPFNALVGSEGGALYAFAYTPYNILLSFSTVGLPLAVSKFVSKYNSMGDYETGMRIYKTGFKIMLVTGVVAFLLMYLSADWLAHRMITSNKHKGIQVEDITMTLRMISFALIIIPAMSITRGFFQGYQSMGPSAVSTVIEQVVRIIFLFIASILVLIVFKGTIATAVGFATFAAFVGALASCLVLFYYWRKRKTNIERQLLNQKVTYNIPMKSLLKELLLYAGPFILVGLATPLYQLVDQFTMERALSAIGLKSVFEVYYAAINAYGHKIILIPVTIATGMSLAIIPALTKAFTENDMKLISKQIHQSLQVIFILVIPACAGLIMLSDVAYGSLFGLENFDLTAPILAWYAPVALLFALFTVSAAILQGIQEQSFAVISLLAGLLMKIVLNVYLIHTFGAKGAIFGTGLAAGIAVTLNLWKMKHSIQFRFKPTIKVFSLVLIFTIIMCGILAITKGLLGVFLPYETNRFAMIIVLGVSVFVGGYIYLWLGYKSTLLERVLGERVRILRKVMR